MEKQTTPDYRQRVFKIIEIGFTKDIPSRIYDVVNLVAIVVNLIACILFTFDNIASRYNSLLYAIEFVTVCFFLVDYGLRIWTADYLHPKCTRPRAVLKYMLSFTGLVDLLSFLPFFLPIFFPAGSVAFRMFRVIRLFRLFRVNAYYDSINVIVAVLYSKSQQLISSVFILGILMVASSLCMYSLEHAAQPGVFANAFSGIWWATSTLLTVGYGDIYPITVAGKAFGIIITFLGVGMVAIPTGIISAGFVEQYTKLRDASPENESDSSHFVKIKINQGDSWAGKPIGSIDLPGDMAVAVILRGSSSIVPKSDTIIEEGDLLILGSKV